MPAAQAQQELSPAPSGLRVVAKAIVGFVWRTGVIGLCLAFAVEPLYRTWVHYCAAQGFTERQMFAFLLAFVHTFTFVVVNGWFEMCDAQGWFSKYKIGRAPAMVASTELRRKTFRDALINHLITSPIAAYLLYPVFKYFGMPPFTAHLPDMIKMYMTFIYADIFNEVGFYWTHRMLHHPSVYATFHKQHHNYKGTVGIAAEYANPVEVVISNQLPTLGLVLFTGSHPVVIAVWLGMRLRQTYEAHSGYCFKGTLLDKVMLCYADSAAFHDFHHTVNKGNFGSHVWDYMFGTMDVYTKMGLDAGYVRALKAKEKGE